ncbi:MAG: TonB-dependent receptor [Terriglobia bacterium]
MPLSIRLASQSLIFVICVGCIASWGQTFQGSFTGTVIDPSGAVVPGAVVTITEKDKGFSRSVTSSKDGSYEIPLLPPGRYALGAQKEGFRKFDRGPLTLLVNQHLREDIKLELGQAGDYIVVEAYPATVESQTSSVGTTIDEQKVNDVPLNGRNFLELALLVPGVSPGTSGSAVSTRGGGGSINVNGMRDSMNSYWLDGLDDTSVGVGQYTVAPPLDSVQEFRMETGVYEAKFGAHAGAEVNMVTKSGTNDVHGSVYEYVRNTDFDARNFFDPSVAPMHRNQFGATLGGPLVLPRIYDGRDHTFFFFAYEGTREHRNFYDNLLVPSVSDREGNFADLLNPACSSQTVLINPLALMQQSVQPFTDISQVLPQADPAGQGLVNQYPTPNIASASCGAANYTALVDRQVNTDTMTGRVDHQFDTKNSLFVRYSLNLDREFWPSGTVPESLTTVPGYGRISHNSYQMAGLDWTHIFSPKLVNEVKLGYNRWQLRQSNEDLGNDLASSLGINGVNQIKGQSAGIPDMTYSGYASMGADSSVPETGAVNTFQVGDTLTHVLGTHTLSYGADVRLVRRGNFTVDSNYRGAYGFTGFVTGGLGQLNSQEEAGLAGEIGLPCAGTGTCQFGNSVADALLGLPQYWLNGFQEYISGAFGEYDFFVQDDWRVRPHLTLNLGLRYEYKSLVTEKNNDFSNFDFSNGDLMVAGTKAATLWSFNPTQNPYTGQLQINPQPCTAQTCAQQTLNLGSTASNRSLQYPDHNNFAPRIGIAWQPFGNSKTVLRGGYGIFYDQTFGDVYFQKAANPPFVHLEEGNIGDALPLIESGTFYPGSGAIIQNALTNIGGTSYPSMSPFQLNFQNAFIQEWSADVQRQVGSTWLIDIGYVGTRGLHLVQETDPNQPLNMTDVSGASAAVQASTLAACQAGSCLSPIPYLANFAYTQSAGSSIYHALQAKVERRFSKGLSVLAAYTYSKSIDTASGPFADSRNPNFPQNSYDVAAEKSVSDFNFPQRLSLAYLWAMPFGSTTGKLQNQRLNYLIQGWEVGSVLTIESGPPFTPVVSGNVSGADEINNATVQADTDRPNVASTTFYPGKQTPQQWVLPSAFSTPSGFTFGNAGRNILRGPGLGSCDFSVLRNFRLGETAKVQFRGEIFNIFNRANFDIPQNIVNAASFGQIFNTVQPVAGLASGGPGEPREVQLGLWLIW